MKTIKNIHIKDSLNIGLPDVLFETVEEIEKIYKIDYMMVFFLKHRFNGIGYVKSKHFKPGRPDFTQVCELDKYEIL